MRVNVIRAAMTIVLLSLGLPRTRASGLEWPQFRGPGGQGHAAAVDLPLTWSEDEGVVWKTPLPGRGWSSPVIDGAHIWMTAAIQSPVDAEERERRLRDTTNSQPLDVSGPLSLRAVCVDRASGELLHDIEVLTDGEPDPIHSLNSFASPTPVLAEGRLFCHFGTHGTACVDTRTGKVLWRNQDHHINHENGPGSSPVLWNDALIVHFDGSDRQYIAAFDTRTGKQAWRTDRSGAMRDNPQMKKAYGTPLVVDVGGRPQLLSPAADWLYAYDPASGRELWKLSYGVLGFSIVPRPVVAHGMVYICTSFMQSELLAVRVERDGEPVEPEIAWRHDRQIPQMPSPLVVGDELYIVSDKSGILTCLDAKTGESIWRERLGGNFSASPLFADGRIYVSSREGVTTVLAPGREARILARNELDGRIMASPVAVGRALFVRTDKALYRIEKPSTSDTRE